MELLVRLGLALAAGLLVGVERGWQARAAAEGSRIAGIRTFGLIGFLGGLWALLAQEVADVLLGVAFGAFAALIILAHVLDKRAERTQSITTVVAALITFGLGALAVQGYETIAAAGAVITATILSLKPVLHRWLQRLEARELYAALKLLLISVVLLPVLPNRGYGPWQALNPYELWWMVVLIAGISFAGYFAMKAAGASRGLLLTGLLGGLVSSTAVTLSFSRLGRQQPNLHRMLAAGIVLAAGTMFPRILAEVAVVNPDLLLPLAVPLTGMTVAAAAGAWWLWRRAATTRDREELPLRNPFQLLPALQFGLLLAAVMVLAEALRVWLGDTGIYVLAMVSGVADVDAITLSLARMARADLTADVAGLAILIAAMMNTIVKAVLVAVVGGLRLAAHVAPTVVVVVFLGTVAALMG